MDLSDITNKMANNAATIQSLSQGVTDEQAQWKPDPDTWSFLEVINHLYDEEREDFRFRLEYILHRPGESWPDIDPQGWVEHRGYNQRDFNQSLSNFLAERESSLNWLKGLPLVDWDTDSNTPFGKITAGDMLAAWVAHDLLHTRQFVELHWAYTLQTVQPYKIDYAGEW